MIINTQSFLEKRVHSRVPVKVPVQFRLVDDPKELDSLKSKTALAKDLSLDGMYIKTLRAVKIGDVFSLDISLPYKSKHLFAFAEVIWSNNRGAGLSLMLMPEEDRNDLKDYMDNVANFEQKDHGFLANKAELLLNPPDSGTLQ